MLGWSSSGYTTSLICSNSACIGKIINNAVCRQRTCYAILCIEVLKLKDALM